MTPEPDPRFAFEFKFFHAPKMTTQVILNPNGSGGDVYPFLAIGQQLQKLGHHVALMTNPMFQEHAGQANLEFIPLGRVEDLVSVGHDPQLQKQSSAWKLALKWIASTVPQGVACLSQRRLRCPTMLVASPLSLSMRLVAEKYSIPMTTLILSPYMLRSRHASSRMPPLCLNRFVPGPIKRMQFWMADRCAIDPILAPILNPIRSELGMNPLKRFLHQWCFSPELNLGLFPEWYAAAQPDWPTGFEHVGSVHWDPKSDPMQTERILRWCDRQICSPLVVLAGSAGPPGDDFYSIWSQAASRMRRGLIVLEPDRAKLPNFQWNCLSKSYMRAIFRSI